MASQLPIAAWERAALFILNNGDNLQRMRYAFHFIDGDADSIELALAEYQNADGGFAHGLEADLRTGHSSVICTTVALQIMGELNISSQRPILRDAIKYLDLQYQRDFQFQQDTQYQQGQLKNWPLINENYNDQAHAPWWAFDKNWGCTGAFLANPGAEIIAYYLQYGTSLCNEIVTNLLTRALEHLKHRQENNIEVEMHELICYRRLYDCKFLGENYKQAMLPSLLHQARALVKVELCDWEEYGLTPITLVAQANSDLATYFADSMELNFEYQIRQQSPEGCWTPRWPWGGGFPDVWKRVETEIKVELTLKFLILLSRFGKLASAPHLDQLEP